MNTFEPVWVEVKPGRWRYELLYGFMEVHKTKPLREAFYSWQFQQDTGSGMTATIADAKQVCWNAHDAWVAENGC